MDGALEQCVSEGVLADYLARRRAEERERTLEMLAGMVAEGVITADEAARRFALTDAEIARIAAALG